MKQLFILCGIILPLISIAQKIEFALIDNNIFYCWNSYPLGSNKTDELQAHHVFEDKQEASYVAASRNSYLPKCWEKNKNGDFIFLSGIGDRAINIKTLKLEENGLSRITFSKYDSLKNKLGEHKAMMSYIKFMDPLINRRPFNPLCDWMSLATQLNQQEIINDIYRYVTYDIKHLRDSVFSVYLRNKKELTIWQYTYPDYGNPSSISQWKDLMTYSKDTIPYRPAPIFAKRKSYLPRPINYNYQSIADSSFFEGHFKIIHQNDNTFCINLRNGNIYYIGTDLIEKVGAIDCHKYPVFIAGKPLIIENRDAETIICFSNVKKLTNKLPFPSIQQIASRVSIHQLFPGLSDL